MSVVSKAISLFSLLFVLVIGIGFARTDALVLSSQYLENSINVLNSIWQQMKFHTAFTILTWLLPLPFGIFIPLRYVNFLLMIAGLVATVSIFVSLLFEEQIQELFNFIQNNKSVGYMWHDTFLIMLVTFMKNSEDWVAMITGPWTCVTHTTPIASIHPAWFIFSALTSIFLILPTMKSFINDDGTLWLEGYESNSRIALIYQSAFIICWIRTYHLVCRDVYWTFKDRPFLASVWLLLGSALVLIYVSSAFALHLAYTSFTKLKFID